jgi:hypothetical protein
MTDILTATRWVLATLKADDAVSALVGARVYDNLAPKGAAYPLVVVTKVSALPVKVPSTGATTLMFDELVQVVAVDQGHDNTVPAGVMNAVRAALDCASGVVTVGETQTGTVIACVEEMEIPLPVEITDGVTYQKSALQFRVYTQ